MHQYRLLVLLLIHLTVHTTVGQALPPSMTVGWVSHNTVELSWVGDGCVLRKGADGNELWLTETCYVPSGVTTLGPGRDHLRFPLEGDTYYYRDIHGLDIVEPVTLGEPPPLPYDVILPLVVQP